MMFRIKSRLLRSLSTTATAMALAAFLTSTAAPVLLHAQTSAPHSDAPVKKGSRSHYEPNRFPKRAQSYYSIVWGINSLSLKAVESGALIRFSYRVLDPEKASVLNDKKVEAFLDSPAENARLSIPSLEKVGQLRQGTTEEAGKTYWMAFSNPRRTVKRGDHVNVVIGKFHADGLVVE
jgi:hypothetical protein